MKVKHYKKERSIYSFIKNKKIRLKYWIIMKLIGDTPVMANLSLPIPILLQDTDDKVMNCFMSESNTIV